MWQKMATSLPHYSYSVCVCARVFGGIDKSIHSVTWFAWLWGRAAFLVPVFALAFSLRLEPSWAKQWWHSPYISLNCTRSNWVLSVLRQPGFLLGRQHGRFTTTWEIPSKYWKRSFQRSQVQQCCTWTLIGLAPLRKAWRKRFLWWRSWVSNLERDMFSLLWGVSCVSVVYGDPDVVIPFCSNNMQQHATACNSLQQLATACNSYTPKEFLC